MPPRRSFRRQSPNTAYKKGDIVEFNLSGSNLKGKLVKKSDRSSVASPIWIVAPSDRRRKNEEVPEKALGRLILDEAANSGNKSKRLGRTYIRDTASSSEDSLEEDVSHASSLPSSGIRRKSTRGSGSGSSEENPESSKKRKSVESNGAITNNRKTRKVTFQDSKRTSKGVVETSRTKEIKINDRKPVRVSGVGVIGTRSTRNNGKVLPELPRATKPKKAMKVNTTRKVKKEEDVKVIKMLTGTLYLYRGETRRAEFVRFKY